MTHDPTLHAWLNDADAPGPTGPDDTSYDVALSELEDLVARVREDERGYAKQTSTAIMAYDEGRRDGYAAALRDAIAAVESREDGDYFPWPQVLIATAAITDLQP